MAENCHKGHREKMRQRFLNSGLSSFSSHEVLELLLYYAFRQKDTNPLAHRLIQHYGSLSAVMEASPEELQNIEGIGPQAAVLLSVVYQVGHRIRMEPLESAESVFDSTVKLGTYFLERFMCEKNETVFELCLDRKGKFLACRRLTEGNIVSVAVNVRKVVENVILTSASTVVLAHNHPGGVAVPSPEDYSATSRIRSALDAVGVALRDHIIVADRDYISMRESGFFSNL